MDTQRSRYHKHWSLARRRASKGSKRTARYGMLFVSGSDTIHRSQSLCLSGTGHRQHIARHSRHSLASDAPLGASAGAASPHPLPRRRSGKASACAGNLAPACCLHQAALKAPCFTCQKLYLRSVHRPAPRGAGASPQWHFWEANGVALCRTGGSHKRWPQQRPLIDT